MNSSEGIHLDGTIETRDSFEQELKDFEYGRMREWAISHLNPEKISPVACFTPFEHMGGKSSTMNGMVLHPNTPLALPMGDVTLEYINSIREKMNEKEGQLFLGKIDGAPVYMNVTLLPITNEMLSSSKPIATFKVTGATNIYGKPIQLPPNPEESIFDKFENVYEAIHKDLKAEFLKSKEQEHIDEPIEEAA